MREWVESDKWTWPEQYSIPALSLAKRNGEHGADQILDGLYQFQKAIEKRRYSRTPPFIDHFNVKRKPLISIE